MHPPFDPGAERDAIAAAVAGEPGAVKQLVERMACVPRVVAAQNARAHFPLDADEVGDVVQDVFLAIVRKLPSFEPRAPLESWIHGVCCMQFRFAVRSKRRRGRRDRDLPDDAVDPSMPEIASLADASEVQAVLARVGGVAADVLRMKHLDGPTFEELGAALAMSPNTVKAHYYRGLATLRRQVLGRDGSSEAR